MLTTPSTANKFTQNHCSMLCIGHVACVVAMLFCAGVLADERIDDVMYQDPAFPSVTLHAEFSEKLKPLWLLALDRPESELQRMAADTIALAHRSGMPELLDTADKLIALLEQENVEPVVRNAAARALVTLNASQASEAFLRVMKSGSLDLGTIVEPALARWNHAPARNLWRERLDDPETERARLILAINGLGTVKDTVASSSILSLVTDANGQLPVRLAAARAAASIVGEAQLNQVSMLAASDQMTENLLAVALLSSQTSAEAVSILKKLAPNRSKVVSGMALRRLLEIDPTNVYEFAATAIGSKDVNIRQVGCEALVHRSDAAAIALLGPVLDDPNPGLRSYISKSLIQLAQRQPLRQDVIQASINVFSADGWRGLEQAIIVLGTLDYEPSAARLFDLLDHQRPEVAIAAGWGLRKLAIVDVLPQMHDQAKQRTKLLRKSADGDRRAVVLDAQLCQLFQAFGQMNYAEPEPVMRTFIPKNTGGPVSARPAAIWAIGKLKEGKLDENLAKLLGKRLADISPSDPELFTVRRMSAVAIGRMNAESQLRVLREFVEEAPNFPGQACAWSLQRMTGEVHEFPLDRGVSSSKWFLRPR